MQIYFHIITGIMMLFPLEILYSQQFIDVAAELGVTDTSIYTSSGVIWVDFDRDGWLDLYVVNGGTFISPYRPIANRLYHNRLNTEGVFVDVAEELGVQALHGMGRAASWADYNQDQWQDLFIINGRGGFGAPNLPNELYVNTGGSFIEQGSILGVDTISVSPQTTAVWGDYDNDGDPDFYVVDNGSGANLLYRNDGEWFTEVGEELGVTDRSSNGSSANWVDYDNDGDLDLFLLKGAGLITPSKLFRNDLDEIGRFVNVAEEVGILPDAREKSAIWGDYDNDGDMDLFIVNFAADSADTASYLFRNDISTTGRFSSVALSLGLIHVGRGVQAAWADYDHDGDLDLFITGDSEVNFLFRNDLDLTGKFTEVALSEGINDESQNRACSWGDYDNDGDLDLYVQNRRWIGHNSLNLLYRNQQNDSNYLKVRPLSENGSFSRYGSRVYVYKTGTDTLVGMREIDGGYGWGSQGQYDAHFGLDGTRAYDIVVRFTTRVNGENIVIDKSVRPELGGLVPVDVGGFIEVRDTVNVIVSVQDEPESFLPISPTLYQNYPNPFNAETLISFYLPKSKDVTLTIYNILGEEIATVHRGFLNAGEHGVMWDAPDAASGIYIYRLKGDGIDISRKMLLLK